MQMIFKKIYLSLAVIPIVLVIFIIVNNNIFSNKKDFALDIDALKEQQSLFTHTRVTITNTGKQPLTNIKVNYGNKIETVSLRTRTIISSKSTSGEQSSKDHSYF